MRTIDLGRRFDAVLAWDSFFHLTADDQRAMFPVFEMHTAPTGLLLFTSGPGAGEAIGSLYGYDLYHASLDTAEYRRLLKAHDFEVLMHRSKIPTAVFTRFGWRSGALKAANDAETLAQ